MRKIFLSIVALTVFVVIAIAGAGAIRSQGTPDPCVTPTPTPTATPTPPPSGESPDNTRVPLQATQITDSNDDVWTISSGWIHRNGSTASGGQGSQILYCNHVVYVFGGDSQWWRWTNGWTAAGTPDPCGGPSATPTPTPTSTPTPEPTPTITTVTLQTANLAHGQGTDGAFNFSTQAQLLSSSDIIAAQEVTPSNLPNWDAAFSALGFTRSHYFPNSSGPNNTNDGQAFWFRNPKVTLLETYTHQLSTGFISWDGTTNVDKSAIAIRVQVADREFVVVNAHLCWSKCADSQATIISGESQQRIAQIGELLTWIDSTFPGEVVLLGDLNLTRTFPGQWELFSAKYYDLWVVGLATGKAHADWSDRDLDGAPDMPLSLSARTADIRWIDYLLLRHNSTFLSLDRIELPDYREPCPQALVAGGNFPACPSVQQQWDVPEDVGARRADHNWPRVTLRIN